MAVHGLVAPARAKAFVSCEEATAARSAQTFWDNLGATQATLTVLCGFLWERQEREESIWQGQCRCHIDQSVHESLGELAGAELAVQHLPA